MTTMSVVSRSSELVNDLLNQEVRALIAALSGEVESGSTERELEVAMWKGLQTIGQAALSWAFAERCRVAMEADLAERGRDPGLATVRADATLTRNTTVGRVRFASYGYRYPALVGTSSTYPAPSRVFPLGRRCQSSGLCLEWAARLASLHAYRQAQGLLPFFTHGAVTIEDTTIARHATRIGQTIAPQWQYVSASVLRTVLEERATCDASTGRPLIYVSCDAHALRRYVRSDWDAHWKMANGIRVWCVDKSSGGIIHVGGEFTTGDSDAACALLQRLVDSGYLPADGDFGEELVATYVFLADGMPWLWDKLASKLPVAVGILDLYHLLQKVAEYAKARFKRVVRGAADFMTEVKRLLLGPRKGKRQRKGHRRRKGHRKSARPTRAESANPPPLRKGRVKGGPGLLALLNKHDDGSESHARLVGYVTANAERIDYQGFKARGMQIGSGAMESLHRTASQGRCKRAGARWLPETLDALFRLRMLQLAGRWDEYFAQPDLFATIADSFVARPSATASIH